MVGSESGRKNANLEPVFEALWPQEAVVGGYRKMGKADALDSDRHKQAGLTEDNIHALKAIVDS